MPKHTVPVITVTLSAAIAALETLFTQNSVKSDTVKGKLMEHAFIVGLATACGIPNMPPIIMMCAMSGRSILTMKEKPTTKDPDQAIYGFTNLLTPDSNAPTT